MKDRLRNLPWDKLGETPPAAYETRLRATLRALPPRRRSKALPALACALTLALAALALFALLPRTPDAPDLSSHNTPLSAPKIPNESMAASQSDLATVEVTDARFDGYRAELTLRVAPADPERCVLYSASMLDVEPELFEVASDPQSGGRTIVRPLQHDQIIFFQPTAVLLCEGGGMLLEDWYAERDETGALTVRATGGIYAAPNEASLSAQATLHLNVQFLSLSPAAPDGVGCEQDGVEFTLSLNAEAQTCATYLSPDPEMTDAYFRSIRLTRTPLSGYLTLECDTGIDPEILSDLFFLLRDDNGGQLALFGGSFFLPPQNVPDLLRTAVFSLEPPDPFPASLNLEVYSVADGGLLYVFPFVQTTADNSQSVPEETESFAKDSLLIEPIATPEPTCPVDAPLTEADTFPNPCVNEAIADDDGTR